MPSPNRKAVVLEADLNFGQGSIELAILKQIWDNRVHSLQLQITLSHPLRSLDHSITITMYMYDELHFNTVQYEIQKNSVPKKKTEVEEA